MDLNEIYIFSKVVESGSFTRAARALGLPNSTVSAKVASLERRLGTTLIQRTTRKLAVTPAGGRYYGRCANVLREITAAEAEVLEGRSEPQGILRVTAPVELGNSVLPDLLTAFADKFPRVAVDVLLTDRRIDLLGEGFDLALRAGELADSSLIARRIATVGFGLYASPHYLERFGVPRDPLEIPKHASIQFSPLANRPWALVGPTGAVSVTSRSSCTANDLQLVKSLAIQHAGLALLPTFFCRTELASERLVRVLPEWATEPGPIHFVYPAQKYVPGRVTAFIELGLDRLRHQLDNP